MLNWGKILRYALSLAIRSKMFFFIPLGIVGLTIVLIGWVVARKFVYLKKLTPQAGGSSPTGEVGFWAELYPEIDQWLKRINLRAYGLNFLNEFEKFLRRLRLLSLKIDTQTNKLISRVRTSSKKHEEILELAAEKAEEKSEETVINEEEIEAGSETELKQQEQSLIIEIAKNPKDARLYRELGIVYMRLEEWHDARLSFEKAIELDPEDEISKRKLGRVLAKE